jgi:hypothetical protein
MEQRHVPGEAKDACRRGAEHAIMSPARTKYQSRENRALVRELFMQHWDPLGVRNEEEPAYASEYDTYVGHAHAMLMEENATAEQIAEYLWLTATDHMAVSPSPELAERCKLTAEKLIELRPQFQTN